jgi:hypothetical protein
MGPLLGQPLVPFFRIAVRYHEGVTQKSRIGHDVAARSYDRAAARGARARRAAEAVLARHDAPPREQEGVEVADVPGAIVGDGQIKHLVEVAVEERAVIAFASTSATAAVSQDNMSSSGGKMKPSAMKSGKTAMAGKMVYACKGCKMYYSAADAKKMGMKKSRMGKMGVGNMSGNKMSGSRP